MALSRSVAVAAIVGALAGAGVGGAVAASSGDSATPGVEKQNDPAYWADVHATAQKHLKALTGSYAPGPTLPAGVPTVTPAPTGTATVTPAPTGTATRVPEPTRAPEPTRSHRPTGTKTVPAPVTSSAS